MQNYKVISGLRSELSEGPIWDEAGQALWWTDIFGGIIYRYNPAVDQVETVIDGPKIAGFSLNKSGGLICAMLEEGLQLWTVEAGLREIVKVYDGVELFFNDSIADANGRFYAGSKYYDPNAEYRLGSLFRVDNNGELSIVEEGLHLSNGMGFSPDNRTFYLVDSVTREINAYDFDLQTGNISNKRNLVTTAVEDGLPDGMTVDAEGFIWCAMWYGSCVIRFDPDGKEERRIETPMTQTSSVMFGGKNLSDLYVTTAAFNFRSHLAPPGYDFEVPNLGGPVYCYPLDIQGKSEYMADVTL